MRWFDGARIPIGREKKYYRLLVLSQTECVQLRRIKSAIFQNEAFSTNTYKEREWLALPTKIRSERIVGNAFRFYLLGEMRCCKVNRALIAQILLKNTVSQMVYKQRDFTAVRLARFPSQQQCRWRRQQ